MPFVSIYNLFKYLKTLTSIEQKDVMRNVGMAVTYNYLWKDEGDYRDFDLQFCTSSSEIKNIEGLEFLVKNEKYDHRSFFGKVLETNYPCKTKDTKPHQVAVFFPGRIAYSISENVLEDPNFLNKNELARELESDYNNVLLKEPWFKVFFRGTNPFVQKKLKVEINMVLLCSDTMFCHPDATYWTEELDTSVLVTQKNTRIDFDVVIEGHWKQGQIVSLVKLNNRVIKL